jgi:hypothetical protein
MGKKLADMLAQVSDDERAKIEARYQELRDEVENLGRLRKLADRSQVQVAKKLGLKQPSVSKIERQTDMYLSTLRNYVEASGGKLELVVRYPNRRPVYLTGFGDLPDPKKAPRRRHSRSVVPA